MKISVEIINYFLRQGFVIVSTIDEKNRIHCSAKGIVDFRNDHEGKAMIVDLYFNRTYRNLKINPTVSVTSVDEHAFEGYTLQGSAKLILADDIDPKILEVWENRIIARISKRLVKSVQKGAKTVFHHEVALPKHPKYLIEMTVENIIDLSAPKILKPGDMSK